jgi:hypothetical protein
MSCWKLSTFPSTGFCFFFRLLPSQKSHKSEWKWTKIEARREKKKHQKTKARKIYELNNHEDGSGKVFFSCLSLSPPPPCYGDVYKQDRKWNERSKKKQFRVIFSHSILFHIFSLWFLLFAIFLV